VLSLLGNDNGSVDDGILNDLNALVLEMAKPVPRFYWNSTELLTTRASTSAWAKGHETIANVRFRSTDASIDTKRVTLNTHTHTHIQVSTIASYTILDARAYQLDMNRRRNKRNEHASNQWAAMVHHCVQSKSISTVVHHYSTTLLDQHTCAILLLNVSNQLGHSAAAAAHEASD
jgi:hypothetical protein